MEVVFVWEGYAIATTVIYRPNHTLLHCLDDRKPRPMGSGGKS